MSVGEEDAEVRRPTSCTSLRRCPHGISNRGDEPLVYVSAAAPAFSLDELYDPGDLRRD
jgi:hypothetical protein